MNPTFRKLAQTGFTLVELLIVVIILAIIAAIVIPQFSSSTTDAQESALDSNLSSMRSAVELFKVQHNGAYPGGVASTGAGAIACTGTIGTGAINTAQAWMDHLLLASDAAGHTCSLSDPITFKFGPYIRKGIPADPITGKGAVLADIVATSTGAPLAPAAATGGWAVDTKSGQIVMNSNAADSKTKLYSTH
jgi:prepilin-type N-terminal cleavage/methylation domain-containing protein